MLKMFSNGKKLTKRKPKESRSFIFTDKDVREYDYDLNAFTYSDKLYKGLRVSVSKYGNHSFIYQNCEHTKVIGSIYNISVDKAREIAKNLREYKDEYNADFDKITMSLYAWFQKYGPYPHKLEEPETVDDTEELRKQIETLTTFNDRLHEENENLKNKLSKIRVICLLDEQIDITDEENEECTHIINLD